MKRTILVLVAALFMLLTCPTTYSAAALGGPDDYTPTLSTKPDTDGPVGTDGEDADDGDSDGLSGHKMKQGFGGTAPTPTAGFASHWVTVKLWWNLLIWYR